MHLQSFYCPDEKIAGNSFNYTIQSFEATSLRKKFMDLGSKNNFAPPLSVIFHTKKNYAVLHFQIARQ